MKAEKIDAEIRKWKNAGNEIDAMKKKKRGLPGSVQQESLGPSETQEAPLPPKQSASTRSALAGTRWPQSQLINFFLGFSVA